MAATVATPATLPVYLKASVATVAGVAIAICGGVRFRQITFDSSFGDPGFDDGRVVRDRQGTAIARAALFKTNTPATVATLATVTANERRPSADKAIAAMPMAILAPTVSRARRRTLCCQSWASASPPSRAKNASDGLLMLRQRCAQPACVASCCDRLGPRADQADRSTKQELAICKSHSSKRPSRCSL